MNAAIEKTKKLKRIDLPLEMLVPQEVNPNEMSDAEFNMLADNFEQVGFVDPIFVRGPLPDLGGKYRIIGGKHRWDVAKLYDFDTVPCTVIDDPDFDGDAEKFQIVRMNVIKGKMSPKKFLELYQSLSDKYASEIAAEAFGFVHQEEFDKLVNQMSKSLPNEMQTQFKEAAKEIKTIDGLSTLLNSMFSKYGSTLPYGYMLLDFGGKDSVWIRMKGSDKKNLLGLAKSCMLEGVTLDSVLAGVLELLNAPSDMAATKMKKELLEKGTKAVFPEGTELPTEELQSIAGES
jgi:hypothetical protein